jgi:hypothetical protein
MEHRWSLRKPADAEVVVYQQGLGKIHGKCRNISLEGICVDMDTERLEKNTLADLVVALRVGRQTILYRMRALAVHAVNGSAGFMFRDFDINFFRHLHKTLYDTSSQELAFLEGSRRRMAG